MTPTPEQVVPEMIEDKTMALPSDRAAGLTASAADASSQSSIPSAENELIADILNACSQFALLSVQLRQIAFQGFERDAPMRVRMIRAVERDALEIGACAQRLAGSAMIHRKSRRGGHDTQGMETREGEDGTASSRSDESPVGNADAPTPSSSLPTGEEQ